MKRALAQALTALLGLLLLSGLLFAGAAYYRIEVLWAGALALLGQSLVVGLAWWGLTLAKQQEELRDLPELNTRGPADSASSSPSSFRMSMGGDAGIAPPAAPTTESAGPMDTGFQRILVAFSGVALLIIAGIIGYFVYRNFDWASKHLDKPFPIAGTLDKPFPLDELSLLLGIGVAALYAVLFNLSRVKRNTLGFAEAVSGNFVMGIGGMVALAGAMILAYMKIKYASEAAAGVIAGLLVLQGLELLANSLRSYSSLDEIDGNAVDLNALPLVPMLTSVWIGGLKVLFAQSLGLSREGQAGVIGRMMPRALLALVILAIAVSCLRVVGPGEVAVVERLGYALRDGEGPDAPVRILKSGLHFQMPWPIDQLVYIPNEKLEYTAVGQELHAPPGLADKVDFRFWRYRGSTPTESEAEEAEYITGDPGSPQLLETFVSLWWRVKDPAQFYNALSHSDFIEKSGSGTKALPIYEALIQQAAAYAVTQAFSIHTLDDILTSGRSEVSAHCMALMQKKLDQAHSGIEVVSLVIKDVHPPVGIDEMDDPYAQPDKIRRGPAAAYEYVIASREIRERLINEALADQVRLINEAHGTAAEAKSQALKYKLDTIARAQGESAKFGAIFGDSADAYLNKSLTAQLSKTPGFSDLSSAEKAALVKASISPVELEELRRQKALYEALKDILPRVNKVLVGPDIDPPQIWQTSDNNKNGPRG